MVVPCINRRSSIYLCRTHSRLLATVVVCKRSHRTIGICHEKRKKLGIKRLFFSLWLSLVVAPPSVAVSGIDGTTSEALGAEMGAKASATRLGHARNGPKALTGAATTKLSAHLSVKDFGAVGDGVTDDTAAINAALAGLTNGGSLHFPAGIYLVRRGNGVVTADNIVANNVRIYGDGSATVLAGLNAAGATPNNSGNEHYNFFQASGRKNILIESLHFSGYLTLLNAVDSTGIVVNDVSTNGLLQNAGGYLRNKAIYLHRATNVRITNNKFLNNEFAVYLSGDATTRTRNALIQGNHFENNVAAGSFTALFPVGVYVYYVDDAVIKRNTFSNIYSSLDNGSTGTGMGYGVYEGDGAAVSLIISNNQFGFDGLSFKNAHPIYTSQTKTLTVTGNRIITAGLGIRFDLQSGAQNYTIANNIVESGSTTQTQAIYINNSTKGNMTVVSQNDIKYGGITLNNGNVTSPNVAIVGNNLANTYQNAAIQLQGHAANPLVSATISDNRIVKPGLNGILLNSYCIKTRIVGNTILDADQANNGTEKSAAIRFTSYSFGAHISGNHIANTFKGGGHALYAVSNASSASDRIYKDIIEGNTFEGFANGTQFHRFFTTTPTNGILDLTDNQFITNANPTSGNSGWQVMRTLQPQLSVDASNGTGKIITVSNTSNMAVGDNILLVKNITDPAIHVAATNWHASTIAAIPSETRLTLTDAIPVGDSTYLAGTAQVKVVRFKPRAAMAP